MNNEDIFKNQYLCVPRELVLEAGREGLQYRKMTVDEHREAMHLELMQRRYSTPVERYAQADIAAMRRFSDAMTGVDWPRAPRVAPSAVEPTEWDVL